MILYNITTLVDWSIHDQWLAWMKESHIPAMMATGYFKSFHLARLLQAEDTDGPTYTVQYYAESIEHYRNYIEKQSDLAIGLANSHWANKLVFFSTTMELVY